MAQSNGAAQPLMDYARGVYNKVENFIGDPSKPAGKKVDPSWHDDMVSKATASFAEPKPVAKKQVAKPAGKRTAPLANKRVGRKRSQ